ncbi:uncharacterized protein I303_103478 [Kwoniella dejecticola CBS 10117]|uniref:Ribosomal protein L10 n=1 Tax=Kwoniella dejecticola CBS 10117 TaxID=1296121 RepID=A0AAJ8KNY2_9TREE
MPPRPSSSVSLRTLTSSRFASTSSTASSSSVPLSSTTSSSGLNNANRIYTARKTFLWNYYTHLVDRSNLILVFDHSNLTSSEWSKIRRAISGIPLPPKPFNPLAASNSDLESNTNSSEKGPIEKANLNVVRTGVLSSLLSRSQSPLEPSLNGQRALLTCGDLSPTYIARIMTSINRTLKSIKRENTPDEKQPSLKLVSALLEGKQLLNSEGQLNEFTKNTPELDVLRAQLVGSLESPSRQLVGVLSQAAGGQLVRALQGLEEGLKVQNEGEGEKSA